MRNPPPPAHYNPPPMFGLRRPWTWVKWERRAVPMTGVYAWWAGLLVRPDGLSTPIPLDLADGDVLSLERCGDEITTRRTRGDDVASVLTMLPPPLTSGTDA